MTTAPAWSPVEDDTADLLSLVACGPLAPADVEWRLFSDAVVRVAHSNGGRVDQNDVRPLIRGRVAPKRIGSFYRRACLEGLLRVDGYSISDDHEGRNAGRPMRCYVLVGASA